MMIKANKHLDIKTSLLCVADFAPDMTDLIINSLDRIGFFSAPCSGGYHLSEVGGLAKHTENVINLALDIADTVEYENKKSVVISALFHDIGKCGQFDKPNYIENILKSGNQSESKPFVTNPDLLYVPHEIRSLSLASSIIELTEEEQFAILMHNGMYGDLRYCVKGRETPLYLILHFADMWASRVTEV